MGDINFDQFKQEIRVAENYLRAETFQQCTSGAFSSRIRSSDDGIALDAQRKELILQSFGRRSLASSQDYTARASYKHDDDDIAQYNRSLFDGESVSKDPYWKEGGRAITIPSGDGCHSSSARYNEPSERENLINRLLADHEFRMTSSSSTRDVLIAASSGISDGSIDSTPQRSVQPPSADSPDSLNSTSDDDDTLFFASDLNPLVNANVELQYSREKVVDASGFHQTLSTDAAIESHSSDVDALSRMGSSGYCPRDLGWGRDRNSDTERISFPLYSNKGKSLEAKEELLSGQSTIGGEHQKEEEEEGEEEGLSDPSHGGAGLRSTAALDARAKHRYDKNNNSRREVDSTTPDSCRALTKASCPLVIVGTPDRGAPLSPTRKYHKSKEQLQIEAEMSFKQQCAFKPTIIATHPDGDNRKEPSGRVRIEEMQTQYKKKREEREKKKKDYLQLQLNDCTFKPQITKMGCKSSRSNSRAGSQLFDAVDFLSGGTGYAAKAVPEAVCKGGAAVLAAMRLHDEAEQRSAQQRWLEKQVEEARLSQFTFQPAINPAVNSHYSDIDHRPIYERVGEIQRGKEDRLRNLKQSHEDAQVDLTFTPQIDARSRRIAERRLESEGDDPDDSSHPCGRGQADNDGASWTATMQYDVGTRLHREALLASRRMKQLCVEREEALVSEMAPARPCRGTEKLAQENVHVGASFTDRQTMHCLRVQQNSTALQKAADCEGASWFKPEVSSMRSASIIASKRPELLRETVQGRAKRMSQEAADGRERRRKEKEDELYGSMTFVPEIDPLSRAIGRSRGLQELVENKCGQKTKEIAKIAADKIEDLKCTFKPSINSYPGSGSGAALNSSFSSSRGAERAEESRYNADLTPAGWAECSLVAGQISSSRSKNGDVEEEGEGVTDEDSLEPLRQRAVSLQCPESLGGLRSRHLDGRHGQYRRCSVNLREPERMSRNIRQQEAAREAKRREELVAREVEEMKECTFQPSLNAHSSSIFKSSQDCTRRGQSCAHKQQPVVVRGLGRHLELKHLSLRQREEANRRQSEVFSVKNIERFRREEDGSTIVKPFLFSEMSDRSSYSRTASLTASASGLNSSHSTSFAAYNNSNSNKSKCILQR